MTASGYPASRSPTNDIRPWNWLRRLLAMLSSFVVAAGVGWSASVEHLWRWSPAPTGLANPSYDPGLAAAVLIALGGAAVFIVLVRRVTTDRFRLLQARSAGARRSPALVTSADSAALFVSTGVTRSRLAATAVGGALLVALCATVFRPWLLMGGLVAIWVYSLQRVASVRVRIGPGGVLVSSPLGWRLLRVPLNKITAIGTIYVDLVSLGGPMAGRLIGHRPLAAAWVLRDGPAMALNLVGGGLVVIGMPHADQAAGLVTGLAGLEGVAGLASPPAAWPTDLLDPDTYDQALVLVKQGGRPNNVAATKLVHTRTQLSVGEARRVVEALIATAE